MTTNEARETVSDELNNPLLWYVYILRLEDGQLYVGQSNDLQARIVEHSIDAGAKATAGQSKRLVWFSHTHDREAARQMEARLRRALERSPQSVEEIVANFDRLLNLIRPQKTLRELQEEERARDLELMTAFHLVPVTFGIPQAACGFTGGGIGNLYGTSSSASLQKMASELQTLRETGLEHHFKGRRPCAECLAAIAQSSGTP